MDVKIPNRRFYSESEFEIITDIYCYFRNGKSKHSERLQDLKTLVGEAKEINRIRANLKAIFIGSLGVILFLLFIIEIWIEQGSFTALLHHLFDPDMFIHHILILSLAPAFLLVCFFIVKKKR